MGEGKPKPFHFLAGSKNCWNELAWLFCILSLHCFIGSSPRAEEMMLLKVLGCQHVGAENHGQQKKVSKLYLDKYQLPPTTVCRIVLHHGTVSQGT